MSRNDPSGLKARTTIGVARIGMPFLPRTSATKRVKAVTHAAMEKGESCGACHGKQAFNFDDCTMCHAM